MAEDNGEKKKRKSWKRPDRSMAQKIVPDEKVAHRINMLHDALWELDPVDLNDAEEVNERTKLFFALCDQYNVKALMETYCIALGWNHVTIWQAMTGKTKKLSRPILQKANDRLLSDLVQLTASGQVNPIPAIFLLKNNYGYTDKVEIATTNADPLGEQRTLPEIKQRMLESVPQDFEDGNFIEIDTPPKEVEAVVIEQ